MLSDCIKAKPAISKHTVADMKTITFLIIRECSRCSVLSVLSKWLPVTGGSSGKQCNTPETVPGRTFAGEPRPTCIYVLPASRNTVNEILPAGSIIQALIQIF